MKPNGQYASQHIYDLNEAQWSICITTFVYQSQ